MGDSGGLRAGRAIKNNRTPRAPHPQFGTEIVSSQPVGRIGDPTEIVGPMIALVAASGSYITGQIVYVDGGVTASQ